MQSYAYSPVRSYAARSEPAGENHVGKARRPPLPLGIEVAAPRENEMPTALRQADGHASRNTLASTTPVRKEQKRPPFT